MKKVIPLFLVLLTGNLSPVFAEQWGTLSGRIVVEGTVGELPDLVKKNDPKNGIAFCADGNIPDEKVIVGKKGGLANCFVYLYQRHGKPVIHPDLQKSARKKVLFTQQGCRFIPHAMVIRTDQVVSCVSKDALDHSIHTFCLRNKSCNMMSPGFEKQIEMQFPLPEPLPISVVCDIHPWMSAKWLVVNHPYAVVTNSDGKFRIPKLPAGKHQFRIWHEVPGYIMVENNRIIEVDISEDTTTNIGNIKVPAAILK